MKYYTVVICSGRLGDCILWHSTQGAPFLTETHCNCIPSVTEATRQLLPQAPLVWTEAGLLAEVRLSMCADSRLCPHPSGEKGRLHQQLAVCGWRLCSGEEGGLVSTGWGSI